ncbi:MAG: hypothetical protein H0A74_02255 [Candidatus Vesicomyosocius endoextente]|uniref:Uncharacterized protein n=1 Tax=Candidatus Vesicomyosocius endoextente TaxID=2738853 RepID=A0A853GC42_9GAMM|nr:hypothetical protein [Candidatus Vesicomyosocius endoextente]
MKTKLYHYQKKLSASLNFNLIDFKTQKRKEKNSKQIKKIKGKLFIKATMNSNLITANIEKFIVPIYCPLIALINYHK